ncbi:MAG: HTH domain-containing protein [Streptococcaceae bacterium]|jgi:predicted DNA-binding transcriptional regulator YafY|nr:HTH domain-containing protein [Streptococcaceae bacterium]
MKKSERLQLILRYINNRAQFTIAEVQREFAISRATAIRNIQEIESMGFPMVTEKGRGGGYFVLPNHFLPEIRFTEDELKAVLVSFLASRSSQLPYLQNRQAIREKLIGIAPEVQQDALIALDDLLMFDNVEPSNQLDDETPQVLNDLISCSLVSRYLEVTWEHFAGFPERLQLFTYTILNSNHAWYLSAYNFTHNEIVELPVAELHYPQQLGLEPENAMTLWNLYRMAKRQWNLVVRLDETAIARFKRMHPPGCLLEYTNALQTEAVFRFLIHEDDPESIVFAVDWLLFLGDGAEIITVPDGLLGRLRTRVENLAWDYGNQEDSV